MRRVMYSAKKKAELPQKTLADDLYEGLKE